MIEIFSQYEKNGRLYSAMDGGRLLAHTEFQPIAYTVLKNGEIKECILLKSYLEHGATAIDIGLKENPAEIIAKGVLCSGNFEKPRWFYEEKSQPFLIQKKDNKTGLSEVLFPKYLEEIADYYLKGELLSCSYFPKMRTIIPCKVGVETLEDRSGRAIELTISSKEDHSTIVSVNVYWIYTTGV